MTAVPRNDGFLARLSLGMRAKGMGQSDLARETNVSRQTINSIFVEGRPGKKHLETFAAALGCTVEWLTVGASPEPTWAAAMEQEIFSEIWFLAQRLATDSERELVLVEFPDQTQMQQVIAIAQRERPLPPDKIGIVWSAWKKSIAPYLPAPADVAELHAEIAHLKRELALRDEMIIRQAEIFATHGKAASPDLAPTEAESELIRAAQAVAIPPFIENPTPTRKRARQTEPQHHGR